MDRSTPQIKNRDCCCFMIPALQQNLESWLCRDRDKHAAHSWEPAGQKLERQK